MYNTKFRQIINFYIKNLSINFIIMILIDFLALNSQKIDILSLFIFQFIILNLFTLVQCAESTQIIKDNSNF